MKKSIIFAIFFILNLSVFSKPNLSPAALHFFERMSKISDRTNLTLDFVNELNKEFNLKKINTENKKSEILLQDNSEFYISTILKTDNNFSVKNATDLGIKLVKISNLIYTAQIPLDKYINFLNSEGLEYVQADGFATAQLDSALLTANIIQIKKGKNNLPQSYSGKGVIVGIIDWGFDYTHPAFYDSLNHKLKITHVWDQTASGVPPVPFSYGKEMMTESDIMSAKTDYSDASHGSHVAGIAAGEGWPTQGKYEGIATDAELVFVALRHPRTEFSGYNVNSFSDFVDAAKYIFDYADKVGKPAVINLSWGNVMGPKDGKSLMSEALESMVGEGKIFVGSAGNSGQSNVHVSKKCTTSDSVLKTYFTYSGNISFTPKEIWLDIWSEENKTLYAKLSAVKSMNDLTPVISTDFFNTLKDTVQTLTLPYSANDTITITAFLKFKEYDTRPRILINVKSKNFIWFSLECKAENSDVHVFSSLLKNGTGYTSYFTNLTDPTATTGNSNYTICDWVSSDRILCIGASVSKVGYKNFKNQYYTMGVGSDGDRATFSSIGPSLDGRIKPDIAAPGSVIVSSVNSYDKNYGALSQVSDMVKRISYGGRTYTYSAYQGTSMSSPVVTGTIALLLEANPKLKPEEAISLLQTTAIRDKFTGDTLPDAYWGYGKLNALSAIGKMLGINSIEPEPGIDNTELFIYPNPSKDYLFFNLKNDFGEFINYQIYDNSGSEVKITDKMMKNSHSGFSTKNLNNGIYFIKLIFKEKTITKKFIIQK